MPVGLLLPAVLMLPLTNVSRPLLAPPLRATMIVPAEPRVLNAAVGLLIVTTPGLPLMPIWKEPLSVKVQLLLTTNPPVPVVGFPVLIIGLPFAVKDFAEAAFN